MRRLTVEKVRSLVSCSRRGAPAGKECIHGYKWAEAAQRRGANHAGRKAAAKASPLRPGCQTTIFDLLNAAPTPEKGR